MTLLSVAANLSPGVAAGRAAQTFTFFPGRIPPGPRPVTGFAYRRQAEVSDWLWLVLDLDNIV